MESNSPFEESEIENNNSFKSGLVSPDLSGSSLLFGVGNGGNSMPVKSLLTKVLQGLACN